VATKTGNIPDNAAIPTESPGFSTIARRIKCRQVIVIMTDNRKRQCVPKTGNTYIYGTVTDRITIPTANLGFSTTPSSKKLNPGRLRQRPTTGNGNIDLCSPILQFLVVDRCHNHLANLLSSSSSSKSWIWRSNFDAICQSSRDVVISGFGTISIFAVVGRCCEHLPTLFSTYTWS